MLKKVMFYAWIIFISVICVYSIYLMYKSGVNYEVSIDDVSYENNNDDMYQVGRADVVNRLVIGGEVAPVHEEEQLEIFIEGNKDDIKIYAGEGNILENGAVYAEYKGVQYKAPNKMYCLKTEKTDDGVKILFLDYSRLYIRAHIPEKYASAPIIKQQIDVKCNENSFAGTIAYVDGYCIDGMVDIRIDYPNQDVLLRAGAGCSMNIVLEEKNDVIAVPTSHVMYIPADESYRVLVVEGGASVSRRIEVGVIGDEMAEVRQGLNENEIIVHPVDETTLRYYLEGNKEQQ